MTPNEKRQGFYKSAIREVELPLFAELRGSLAASVCCARMPVPLPFHLQTSL